MGRILDRAEACWTGRVDPREFWKPTGEREEIAPGVHFVHAFANVTVIRTAGGFERNRDSSTSPLRKIARQRAWAYCMYVAVFPSVASILSGSYL